MESFDPSEKTVISEEGMVREKAMKSSVDCSLERVPGALIRVSVCSKGSD